MSVDYNISTHQGIQLLYVYINIMRKIHDTFGSFGPVTPVECHIYETKYIFLCQYLMFRFKNIERLKNDT